MGCVYAIMIVLYFSVDDFATPFDTQPFAFRVYMTLVGVCMLFELLAVRANARPLFVMMQWSSYLLCGFHNLPYWILAYLSYVCLCALLEDAEARVAALDQAVAQNGFQFDNVHQLSLEPLKLAAMTEAQQNEMKTLNEFRQLRAKGEVPVQLSYHEKILWNLSDNTGLVYTREKRRWLVLVPYLSMWILYALWWHAVTWYTLFDALMLLTLLQHDPTLTYMFYHLSFVLAILYARHKPFNYKIGL